MERQLLDPVFLDQVSRATAFFESSGIYLSRYGNHNGEEREPAHDIAEYFDMKSRNELFDLFVVSHILQMDLWTKFSAHKNVNKKDNSKILVSFLEPHFGTQINHGDLIMGMYLSGFIPHWENMGRTYNHAWYSAKLKPDFRTRPRSNSGGFPPIP